MSTNRPRTYRVNTDVANTCLDADGLTVEEFARKFPKSEKTIRRLLHGEPVYLSTVKLFAEFFDKQPGELLSPAGDQTLKSPNVDAGIGEWSIERPLGPVTEAPNGLQYRVFQLTRADGVGGRGKRYVLDHLSADERRHVQEHLLRHTNVCNQVGEHPNITRHLEIKSASGEDLWWVIDQWFDGELLGERFDSASIPLPQLLPWMRDIACGLQHLHNHDVIMRQLSPSAVILREDSNSAVLADFEMAKLLDRRPTVSPREQWPEDAYRAPEVGGPTDPGPEADTYSWARLWIHGLTGATPPTPGRDLKLLKSFELPEFLATLIASCLSLDRTKRPRDMAKILRVLK